MILLAKARAGRRAALASLATRDDHSSNVVSIFDFEPQAKPAPIPTFTSIRSDEGQVIRLAA